MGDPWEKHTPLTSRFGFATNAREIGSVLMPIFYHGHVLKSRTRRRASVREPAFRFASGTRSEAL